MRKGKEVISNQFLGSQLNERDLLVGASLLPIQAKGRHRGIARHAKAPLWGDHAVVRRGVSIHQAYSKQEADWALIRSLRSASINS